jgi:hypothetical protein
MYHSTGCFLLPFPLLHCGTTIVGSIHTNNSFYASAWKTGSCSTSIPKWETDLHSITQVVSRLHATVAGKSCVDVNRPSRYMSQYYTSQWACPIRELNLYHMTMVFFSEYYDLGNLNLGVLPGAMVFDFEYHAWAGNSTFLNVKLSKVVFWN